MSWRTAWEQALYGPSGFYRRPEGPAGHFRTSVHVSPLFARAIVTLLSRVDDALGNPDSLDLVDVGSGRGELLIAVAAELPPPLAARARLTGVDVVPRPAGLPAGIGWADTPPAGTVGLLLAHEWLDDVPCEVAEVDPAGTVCQVLVNPADGTERLGEPVTGAAAEWLHRWWPLTEPGTRAEIGTTRDVAWAAAVSSLRRGVALAVDYGHTAAARPLFGSLAGFARGAEVDPVPDGTRNVTAHVAIDAVAAAGAVAAGAVPGVVPGVVPGAEPGVVPGVVPGVPGTVPGVVGIVPGAEPGVVPGVVGIVPGAEPGVVPGTVPGIVPGVPGTVPGIVGIVPGAEPPVLYDQRTALHALGVHGTRPDRALASADPAEYLQRLVAAGEGAELTDRAGLGAFGWLLQPVGVPAAGLLSADGQR
jgi:hypothetical protein